MTKPLHAVLSRRERQIMDILYRRGRATANEVMADLTGNPRPSTVRTQLRVLESKGPVRHQEEGLRYVYMVALVCAVAMPLLTIVAPVWHIPVSTFAIGPIAPRPATVSVKIASRQSPARGFDQTADTPRMADGARRGMSLPDLVGLLWAVGAAASTSVLFVGFARLRRIAKRAELLETGRWAELTEELARANGIHRPVTLLRSDHPTLLVTWGVMRPRIVLPFVARDWTDDRARIVLRHELPHVRRGDWAVQIAAEIGRSPNWFNPGVWLASPQL